MSGAADTHTVSLMAEAETTEGVFEDVILGTYPSEGAALRAAKDHVRVNPEAQAQVMAALPDSPEFTSWDSLVAFVDVPEDGGGITVEQFT